MLKSTSFIFDGIPSENFGVMIYFLEDSDTKNLELGTDVEVIEERLPKRITPIHYGVDINKSMSFPLTFGSTEYLSDYDVDAILSWLTGHNQYKWLEYVDGDHYVRYKCHLNNMKSVYINGLPVAFECDVECDGQFAYEYNTSYEYNVTDSEQEIEFVNKSSYNGYLYPKMQLEFSDDCNGVSIYNDTDNGREFKVSYFDRESNEGLNKEQTEDVTLQYVSSNSYFDESFVAWSTSSISVEYEFNDVVMSNECWVALPKDGDIALYSKDEGTTWNETKLPYSGSWTGCYGTPGFVAICTTPDTAIASYSLSGDDWSIAYPLPALQTWNRVKYIETKGAIANRYVTVGGDSNIIAISSSGRSWQSVELPVSQEWRSVFSGNNRVFIVGGDSNIAVWSYDCLTWYEFTLPRSGCWTDGCYSSTDGFVIISNTLHGSGSQSPIALHSKTGDIDNSWDIIEMPIGAWSHIAYSDAGYIAIGEKMYACSIDLNSWTTGSFTKSVVSLAYEGTSHICATDSGVIFISNHNSSKQGSYTFAIGEDSTCMLHDLKIYAHLQNQTGVTSYNSEGEVLLASYSEAETIGGNFLSLAIENKGSGNAPAVTVSAIYESPILDSESGNMTDHLITVNFVADSTNAELMKAPLAIRVEYTLNEVVDYGYDGLIVNFDNQNQIITTNKDTLNMYEYFNRKFFRLVKGVNKLRMSTNGGTCKVILNCEFLRKVGGR